MLMRRLIQVVGLARSTKASPLWQVKLHFSKETYIYTVVLVSFIVYLLCIKDVFYDSCLAFTQWPRDQAIYNTKDKKYVLKKNLFVMKIVLCIQRIKCLITKNAKGIYTIKYHEIQRRNIYIQVSIFVFQISYIFTNAFYDSIYSQDK